MSSEAFDVLPASELSRVMPPRPSLPRDVSEAHKTLLVAIALPMLKSGKAPLWEHILDECDEKGLDAEQLLRTLPRIGRRGLMGPSYGFTSPPRTPMTEMEEVRVTVAAGLVLPELKRAIGQPFLLVLHHMIKLYKERPRSATEHIPAVLRSTELAGAIPSLSPTFIAAFPSIWDFEPLTGHGGGSTSPEGHWERIITRDVLKFRDATTIEAYADKVGELVTAAAGQETPGNPLLASLVSPSDVLPTHGRVAVVPKDAPVKRDTQPEPEPYVDLQLLKELEEAGAKTKWSLDKLLRLADELNRNFADGNFYTCLALVRAIGDHIPPVFEKKNWIDLHSSYKWTRPQDKSYADTLNWYRDPANDVLHRPMGETASRIAQRDVPPPHALNGVLQELLVLLKAQGK